MTIEIGPWNYEAGSSGTVTIPKDGRVLGIAAAATSAGATLTINGGDAVPIPANMGVEISPNGNLYNPTLVFTNTVTYFVEWVSGG